MPTVLTVPINLVLTIQLDSPTLGTNYRKKMKEHMFVQSTNTNGNTKIK